MTDRRWRFEAPEPLEDDRIEVGQLPIGTAYQLNDTKRKKRRFRGFYTHQTKRKRGKP